MSTKANLIRTCIFAAILAGSSFLPQIAKAQTDCNQLARDLVQRNLQSSWSDYSKLLFLSMLTQMDEQSAKDALGHTGSVSVGPISIGPGTWSKETQNQLRSALQKIVDIEQIQQSAASISVSSGDPNVTSAVNSCILSNGGLYVDLTDLGKGAAVLGLRWTSYPGSRGSKATIETVTVIHGSVIEKSFIKKGTKLEDGVQHKATIQRNDPKQDLAVIVNADTGSGVGYLPPSELPPPQLVKETIESKPPIEVGSGGRYDGDRNPGCTGHQKQACVTPQHGGRIIPGSGHPHIIQQTGNTGTKDARETEQEYCITFWADTGACETPVFVTGTAAAIEEHAAGQ